MNPGCYWTNHLARPDRRIVPVEEREHTPCAVRILVENGVPVGGTNMASLAEMLRPPTNEPPAGYVPFSAANLTNRPAKARAGRRYRK